MNPLSSRNQQTPDINALFQQFSENPTKYLTGLNVPAHLKTPEQIVEYLFSNGKVPPILHGRINALRGKVR